MGDLVIVLLYMGQK